MKTKEAITKKGLNKRGRINWDLPENLLAEVLSKYGLHAHAISRETGLSRSAIYYRNKILGIRIRDYRDGVGPVARQIFKEYNIRTVEHMPTIKKEVQTTLKK